MKDSSRDIDIIDDTYQNILPYMIKNIPVLVRSSTEAWSNIQMDLCQLRNRSDFCAKYMCTVVECNDACLKLEDGMRNDVDIESSNEYSSQTRISTTLEEFFCRALDSKEENIYLKDWHLDQIPGLNFEYRVPQSFSDDWLNWYWKSCRASDGDDYSFLYMGGARTYTSLHHDVCCSNSWSINLFGYKKWTLWPPCESYKLSRDYPVTDDDQDVSTPIPFRLITAESLSGTSAVNNLKCASSENCQNYSATDGIDVANIDESNIDRSIFANYLINKNTHDGNDMVADARDGYYDNTLYKGVADSNPIVFVQSVGEAVFVPSGWYHQVENLPHPNRIAVIENERKKELDSKGQFMEGEIIENTRMNCESTKSEKAVQKKGQNDCEQCIIMKTFDIRDHHSEKDNQCVHGQKSIDSQNVDGLEDKKSRSIHDLTVSLNRNWFNGFSVYEVWLFLCRELDAVREELWYLKPSWGNSDIHIASFDEISNSNSGASDEWNHMADRLQINRNDSDNTFDNQRSWNGDKGIKGANGNSCKLNIEREDISASFAKFANNNNELPPMGIVEWHKHCEVLLRANSAINFMEFLELIAARVLMMDTCKNILLERRRGRQAVGNIPSQSTQADICRDHDRKNRGDITENVSEGIKRAQNHFQDQDIPHICSILDGCNDVGGRGDNFTDEKSKPLQSSILNDKRRSQSPSNPSSWHYTLCPRYKMESVSEEDIEIFALLSATTTSEKDFRTSKNNYLSHYIIPKKRGESLDQQQLYANDGSCTSSCFTSLSADFQKPRNVEDDIPLSKSPFTALELTCRQLQFVISDMISSRSVLLHLSCSLVTESNTAASDTETSISESSIFHSCDRHLKDLHNLLNCVSNLRISSQNDSNKM